MGAQRRNLSTESDVVIVIDGAVVLNTINSSKSFKNASIIREPEHQSRAQTGFQTIALDIWPLTHTAKFVKSRFRYELVKGSEQAYEIRVGTRVLNEEESRVQKGLEIFSQPSK